MDRSAHAGDYFSLELAEEEEICAVAVEIERCSTCESARVVSESEQALEATRMREKE